MDTDNSGITIELRREQNTLTIVGTGVIVFGFWTVFKMLSTIFIRKNIVIPKFRESSGLTPDVVDDKTLFIVIVVMLSVIFLLGLAVRLFIGFSAIADARGKLRLALYLPVTCLYVLLSSSQIVQMLRILNSDTRTDSMFQDVTMSSVVIELTSMVMMVEMIAAAVRIRKYRKKIRAGRK